MALLRAIEVNTLCWVRMFSPIFLLKIQHRICVRLNKYLTGYVFYSPISICTMIFCHRFRARKRFVSKENCSKCFLTWFSFLNILKGPEQILVWRYNVWGVRRPSLTIPNRPKSVVLLTSNLSTISHAVKVSAVLNHCQDFSSDYY